MLEKYGTYMLLTGIATTAIALVWYFTRVARKGRAAAIAPRRLLVLGIVLIAVPYGLAFLERNVLPLRPYEQMVDGELRITLTGLKDFDYAALAGERPDVVVLQMANPDVTDAVLLPLAKLTKLRTLDVRDGQVTDAGLATIAAMPALEEVYLGRTRITDAGFQQYLMPKESLRKVDLTGTDVKGKTKREWKNRRPDVREYTD